MKRPEKKNDVTFSYILGWSEHNDASKVHFCVVAVGKTKCVKVWGSIEGAQLKFSNF